MGTKLYVANLPEAPSAPALRAHFGVCGTVADVQIMPDRNAGRGRTSAFVRMSNAAGAQRALSELNGAPFAGQLLLIEAAPDDRGDWRRPAPRREAKNAEDGACARIMLQFREPANMAYELDCEGIAIVVRVFFQDESGGWRIAVQPRPATDTASTAATAPSRVEALRNVARACREGVDSSALARVDWEAVEVAMLKVRAL